MLCACHTDTYDMVEEGLSRVKEPELCTDERARVHAKPIISTFQ